MSNLVIQGGRLNKQYSTSMLDSAIAIITTTHRDTVFQPRSAISRSSVSQPNRRSFHHPPIEVVVVGCSIFGVNRSISDHRMLRNAISPASPSPHQPLLSQPVRQSVSLSLRLLAMEAAAESIGRPPLPRLRRRPFATPPAEKETNLLRGDIAQNGKAATGRGGSPECARGSQAGPTLRFWTNCTATSGSYEKGTCSHNAYSLMFSYGCNNFTLTTVIRTSTCCFGVPCCTEKETSNPKSASSQSSSSRKTLFSLGRRGAACIDAFSVNFGRSGHSNYTSEYKHPAFAKSGARGPHKGRRKVVPQSVKYTYSLVPS